MTSEQEKAAVVVVAGPTAAGKSELAVRLAERFSGEIINADSMQVYRYLDIGTAKPGLALRERVPHHLLDLVDPKTSYDAARYANDAREAEKAIRLKGKIAFLTGGTGLYIRAFLTGLIETGRADPELRAALESEAARAEEEGDPGRLHRRLAATDPESAARIHPHDQRRIVRALEIMAGTGEIASQLRASHDFADTPYRALYLVVDPGRPETDVRIAARARGMIEAGLLQEVRALRDRGYGPELRALQAIGYRHLGPVVDGRATLADAEAEIVRDTRRFARRQRTWFRRVSGAVWMDPREEDAIFGRVERFLEAG